MGLDGMNWKKTEKYVEGSLGFLEDMGPDIYAQQYPPRINVLFYYKDEEGKIKEHAFVEAVDRSFIENRDKIWREVGKICNEYDLRSIPYQLRTVNEKDMVYENTSIAGLVLKPDYRKFLKE
jgi:hypothetical protein